jgi:hypothetical protein
MRIECWILKATNTHSDYVYISCFSTATKVATKTLQFYVFFLYFASCLVYVLTNQFGSEGSARGAAKLNVSFLFANSYKLVLLESYREYGNLGGRHNIAAVLRRLSWSTDVIQRLGTTMKEDPAPTAKYPQDKFT